MKFILLNNNNIAQINKNEKSFKNINKWKIYDRNMDRVLNTMWVSNTV